MAVLPKEFADQLKSKVGRNELSIINWCQLSTVEKIRTGL